MPRLWVRAPLRIGNIFNEDKTKNRDGGIMAHRRN